MENTLQLKYQEEGFPNQTKCAPVPFIPLYSLTLQIQSNYCPYLLFKGFLLSIDRQTTLFSKLQNKNTSPALRTSEMSITLNFLPQISISTAEITRRRKSSRPVSHPIFYLVESYISIMQAPVIIMNEASARQTGRKAQTSNITAAKVLTFSKFVRVPLTDKFS